MLKTLGIRCNVRFIDKYSLIQFQISLRFLLSFAVNDKQYVTDLKNKNIINFNEVHF